MERIYQIRLSKVVYEDLYKFFDFKIRVPDYIENYSVQPLFPKEIPISNNPWYEDAYFRVYDANHNMLGEFRIKNYSEVTTINFYCLDEGNKQGFLDYIESTIEEMKLAGFTILDTQESGVDNVNREDEGNSNSILNRELNDTSTEISFQANNPWQQIDEDENHKKVIRLLHEGLSAEEIAFEMSYGKKTIYNWTSKLRIKYGKEIVPYFQSWRNNKDEGNPGNK